MAPMPGQAEDHGARQRMGLRMPVLSGFVFALGSSAFLAVVNQDVALAVPSAPLTETCT